MASDKPATRPMQDIRALAQRYTMAALKTLATIMESGASEQKDLGGVMKALMPRVGGRADGKRVSQAVREKLGA